MQYAYPAIFTPAEEGYRVRVPDLPALVTYGTDMADACLMAQDAIAMWLWDAENKRESIPAASMPGALQSALQKNEFISLMVVDTDAYRRAHDARAVKKTLTIPAWLNHEAEAANAPFSQILQQGLKSYLGMRE